MSTDINAPRYPKLDDSEAQTKAAQRLSERLQIATRAGHLGIWDWNVVDNIQIWDDTICDIYGIPHGSFTGGVTQWIDHLHPEDQSRVDNDLQAALRGEREYAPEFRVIWPDGSIRNIKANSQTFFDENGKPLRMVGTNIDITERKQAQIASNRLAAIVESSHDAIIGTDFNGILTSWNKGAESIFGYPAGEMIGTSITRLIPASRLAEETMILETIQRGESLENFETLRLRKDGKSIGVSITASPIRDVIGKIIGVSKIARDTTERQQAETTLREHDAFNASVLDSVADQIGVLDTNGVILFVNRAWRQFNEENSFPQPAVDPVGYNYLRVCKDAAESPNGAEAAVVEAGLQAILSGAQASFQLEYPCHSATDRRWFLMTITRLVGAQPGVVISHKDITALVLAAATQRETEARFQVLVDNLHFGVLLQGPRTEILLSNPKALEMLGVSEDQLLGRTSFDPAWNVIHEDGSAFPVPTHPVAQAIATGRPVRGVVMGVYRPTKQDRIWLRVDAEPQLTCDGVVSQVICTFGDITDTRALEEQLRESQKMEAIGTLAGGIAHDFNNILSGIYGYLSLAQLPARDHPELLDYLKEISGASDRAAELVRQILSFSRSRGGDESLEPMQLSHLVAEAVKLLRAACPSTVEIVQQLAPNLPPVQGNASQLHQVMMNLGTNALHALGERSGRLTVRLEAIEVDYAMAKTLSDLQPGRFVRLTVGDNGCGMDEATQRRVFEPFFTTKGPDKGTGLGLSVVHGIVRRHHGAIRLTSEVGRSTTFEIFLPVAAALPVPAPDAVAAVPHGHGERILLVDDEETIAKVGQHMLIQLGYTAESARGALQALARLERDPQAFDLVVSDQTMPGMTGLQFAERIRALRPDLPVVLTSGNSTALTPERLRAAGVRELLDKPFSLETLALAIRRHLPTTPSQ